MTERRYNIAIGKSRFERVWRNEAWTWEELTARLRRPVVTGESAADYRAMTRDRQTAVKDVGGFVGGYLSQGRRKAGNVVTRSVVTLDYDDFDESHLADLRESLPCRWALHSTHKHSDDAWRVRLVVATDREMTPDEYGAVARKVAEKAGFCGLDRTTFDPCRLMFWPSRSSDGAWLWEESEGEPLSVKAILGEYRDWRDMSSWPLADDEEEGLHSRRTEGMTAAGALLEAGRYGREAGRYGRQEDPLTKKGWVGAFCRTYTVGEAIGKFLPERYSRAMGNRWTHTGSTTSGGAWELDGGRFLYSFHATDPLQGLLLNSWDLVRLSLFGDEDSRLQKEERQDRLPSVRLMQELAMGDGPTKARMIRERAAEAAGDFAALGDLGGVESAEDPEKKARWAKWEEVLGDPKMKAGKDGTLRTTIGTVEAVLRHEPRIRGVLRKNEFQGMVEVVGEMPWRREGKYWTNDDDTCLRAWLDREYGMTGKEKIADAVTSLAVANGYHPVKVYLESLTWDGERRLSRVLTDILGAEDTPLNRELPELHFKAACRRIYRPGEKYDYFPILVGPEGCGKSSLFRIMGGEWFSDSIASIEGKEGMEGVRGKLIIEMPELVGTKRSDQNSVKSFISRQVDKFRPAYGKREEVYERTCVMAGTTNDQWFIRGIGERNRRHPVVEINPGMRKTEAGFIEWLTEWRDQLWAEAMDLHRRGGPLVLSAAAEGCMKEVQDAHNLDLSNPLFAEIDHFLDMWLPYDWESMGTQSRREWLLNPTELEGNTLSGMRREFVTVPEILQELLGMERRDKDYRGTSREIGQYLNSLEGRWSMIGTRRKTIYGAQKTWQRCATESNQSLGCSLTELL